MVQSSLADFFNVTATAQFSATPEEIKLTETRYAQFSITFNSDRLRITGCNIMLVNKMTGSKDNIVFKVTSQSGEII